MLVLLLSLASPAWAAPPGTPDYDALATSKRLEVIDQVKQMLADPLHAERRPQLLHRLAELTAAQARELELGARGRHQAALDRCFDTDGCGPDDVPLDRGFEDWYRSADRAYAALARQPHFAQAAEAAWGHSLVLEVLDRPDEASAVWLRLVKLHPEAPEAPLAYAKLGDRFFDAGLAAKALAAYRRGAVEGSPLADYSRHRVAWCQYNLGDLDGGIDTLKSLATGAGDLADQALDDLGRFFADAGRLDDAYVFYASLGQPQRVRGVLGRMAQRADDNGHVDEAIAAWRRLILDDALAADASALRGRIAKALRRRGDLADALEEIEAWVAAVGPGSPWADAHPERTDAALGEARAELVRVTTEAHERARRLTRGHHGEASDVQALAQRGYDAFFVHFADSEPAAALRFGQAELHWERGRFDDARAAYVAVVRADPAGPQAAFSADAAVLAAEKGVADGDGGPFTDADAALVEACDLLVAHFPDHAKVPDALYKSGHLLYRRGRVAQAADRFEQVIARDPGAKEAEFAAHLVLDGLARAEDWAELEARAGFFAGQDRLGSRTFRREARDIEARAGFKHLEALAATDPAAAGDRMVAWTRRFDGHPERALALNNAAAWLQRAGDLEAALAARHQLVGDHPASEWVQPALAAIGHAHEQVVRYPEAASAYSELLTAWITAPSDRIDASQVADAAHSAAVLWAALGDGDRARAAYGAFADTFGDDPRVPDARLAIARLWGEDGRWDEAADAYAAFVVDPGSADSGFRFFAQVRQARALEEAGDPGRAAAVYERTAAAYRAHLEAGGAPGATTTYAAEALFRLAEPGFAEFAAIELIGRDPRSHDHEEQLVRDATRDKVRALAQTRAAYEQVVSLGAAEWGLRALVKVGEAHEQMASALRDAPCLQKLTESQCRVARLDQEDLAAINEGKSADAYLTVVERASALGWSDDAVVFAAMRLSALRPDVLEPLYEEPPPPLSTGASRQRPGLEPSL